MSSFKKLSRADVTVVPYHANKQWDVFYSRFITSSEYLTVYNGIKTTGNFSPDTDSITSDKYDRLVYTQINQLFYQDYVSPLDTSSLANSIYYESSSQQRPTSSYFVYNDNDKLIKYFPTGTNEEIKVIAVNQEIYGNKILPNHFVISSSFYYITDDGYGNLYDIISSPFTHVGNVYYAHGLAIITNQSYQTVVALPPVAKSIKQSFLISDTPKTISASLNAYARIGNLDTSSIQLSGSTSGVGYSWATGSQGTVILTTTDIGTYEIYYTINCIVGGPLGDSPLTSNKGKITANVQ